MFFDSWCEIVVIARTVSRARCARAS